MKSAKDLLKTAWFSIWQALKIAFFVDIIIIVILFIYGGLKQVFNADVLWICIAVLLGLISIVAALALVGVVIMLFGAAILGICKLLGKPGERFIEWLQR